MQSVLYKYVGSTITSMLLIGSVAWAQSNTFPSSGSVGIGTLDPGEHKLFVNGGDIRVANGNEGQISFGNTNGQITWIEDEGFSISTWDWGSQIEFLTRGGGRDNKITINQDGALRFGNGTGIIEYYDVDDKTLYGKVPGFSIAAWDWGSQIEFLTRRNKKETYRTIIDEWGNLNVANELRAKVVAITSDERLKTNILPLSNTLEKLSKIQGVSFEWNDMAKKISRSTGRKELGVLAQEVESVFPEVIRDWNGYKAVEYNKLVSVLISAVNELRHEKDMLESRILKLEKYVIMNTDKKPYNISPVSSTSK